MSVRRYRPKTLGFPYGSGGQLVASCEPVSDRGPYVRLTTYVWDSARFANEFASSANILPGTFPRGHWRS